MLVSFSWILPANCLGLLFIVMRMAFLEDVICANHIVQAVLMMSKPSAHSGFQALVPLRLMHMGLWPRCGGRRSVAWGWSRREETRRLSSRPLGGRLRGRPQAGGRLDERARFVRSCVLLRRLCSR